MIDLLFLNNSVHLNQIVFDYLEMETRISATPTPLPGSLAQQSGFLPRNQSSSSINTKIGSISRQDSLSEFAQFEENKSTQPLLENNYQNKSFFIPGLTTTDEKMKKNTKKVYDDILEEKEDDDSLDEIQPSLQNYI